MQRNIYLALGDSITAGYGATHPSMTFVHHVDQFAREKALAEHTMVIAQNGWTSKDVWRAASSISRSTWERTSVISLMAGGNDLRRLLRRLYLPISGSPITPSLVHSVIQEFGYHMNMLCGFIHQYGIPYVVVATVYNPAPHFPVAVDAIHSLNGVIREIADHNEFSTVDVHEGFHKNEPFYIEGYRSGRFEDLASPFRRPIHPNNAGHRQIADLITKRLELTLSERRRGQRVTRQQS